MDSGMQQQQMSSGLTRYRSAPSSYFASILSTTPITTGGSGGGGGGFAGDDVDHLMNTRVSNRHGFPRFTGNSATENFAAEEHTTASSNIISMQSHFGASAVNKPQVDIQKQQQQQQERGHYAFASKMYQAQSQAQCPPPNLQASSTSDMDNSSYRLAAPVPIQMKTGGLIRHSSSPAGLFDRINIKYEYDAMRSMGGVGNNANAEASVTSSNWFKKDTDFSSAQPSGLGEMTPISEMEVKDMGEDGLSSRGFGESHRNSEDNFITSILDSASSWEESAILSDEFLKGLGDSDRKLFSSVNNALSENNEGQNRPPTSLTHQLSLPTSSAELAAVEKLSEDTVLCKIRAKRGCATHPRSIAERVRRTRISERMRKLQELVPNMDKQTNTADMLDLAVDYIKDLEKELKVLQDNGAKCTCMLK